MNQRDEAAAKSITGYDSAMLEQQAAVVASESKVN